LTLVWILDVCIVIFWYMYFYSSIFLRHQTMDKVQKYNSFNTDYYFTQLTNKLTPWSTVLLEKLTFTQLVKKFPAFYERKGSLPCWQWSALRPCVTFHNKLLFLQWRVVSPPAQTPRFRPTPCRLSVTIYSIYSQLLSISGGCLLNLQPKDVPCRGVRDPHKRIKYILGIF
jgi:hypothetical protein